MSTEKIAGSRSACETRHIVIKHRGKFRFWEGQSVGVILPENESVDDRPELAGLPSHLYSIASSRYGDDKQRNTLSICVQRNDNDDSTTSLNNYLCDLRPGSKIKMIGPLGKHMIFPEDDTRAEYIMIATGTGVAPFRGYLRRLFAETTRISYAFKGLAWLFVGGTGADGDGGESSVLYESEFRAVERAYPKNFRFDRAFSQENHRSNNGSEGMEILEKIEKHSEEIFDRVENGAHIFLCGSKDIIPGVSTILKAVAESKGIDYDSWIRNIKSSARWHEEVQ